MGVHLGRVRDAHFRAFDDWWHNTCGFDVKILSPPHAVRASGIDAIQIGAMLMALAWQNRANGLDRHLQLLFVYGAGLLLPIGAVLSTEDIRRWGMHRSLFYQVSCGVFPFLLVSAVRASAAQWPVTLVASVYSAVVFLMLWNSAALRGASAARSHRCADRPLHAARAALLLVVPALFLDPLMRRWRRGDWLMAAAMWRAGAVNVFAHLHPSGSVSMAALQNHRAVSPTGEVATFFTCPRAGRYRVWVQLKSGGDISTNVD